MRKIYNLVLIGFITILTACSNDFLDENKNNIDNPIKTEGVLALDKKVSEFTQAEVTVNGLPDGACQIIKYPSWLEINSNTGSVSNNILNFSYRTSSDINLSGGLGYSELGTVYFKQNNNVYTFNIVYQNLGNPTLSISTDLLNFGKSKDQLELSITNTSNNGIVVWSVDSTPEWLICSSSPKAINPFSIQSVLFTLNREKLEEKDYEGKIIIKTNDKSKPNITIQVKVSGRKGNADNIYAINGTVKDVYYSKVNDELYVLTQNPDNMVVFKNNQQTIIELPKSPNCISTTEDGKLAYIGFSELVTEIDIPTRKISKQFNIDLNTHSVVLGENGYCYFTTHTTTYSGDGLYAINLKDGNTSRLSRYSSQLDRNSNLIKVMNKPYIIGSRENVSPNGVILLDLSKLDDNNNYTEYYWHQSLGKKIFQTENGNYLIGSYGSIVKTPTINTSTWDDLPEIGKFNEKSSYSNEYLWIDHNAKTNTFYAINQTNSYYNPTNTAIKQFNGSSYYWIKDIPFEKDYYTSINNVSAFYEVTPYYIFSSKAGDILYVIRNISDSQRSIESWSLETISIK